MLIVDSRALGEKVARSVGSIRLSTLVHCCWKKHVLGFQHLQTSHQDFGGGPPWYLLVTALCSVGGLLCSKGHVALVIGILANSQFFFF